MKKADRYLKIVEWSDEDRCYVGRCPELMLGGVHGRDEKKVFADLCAVVDRWIAQAEAEGEQLPPGLAGKKYSGKFNVRLGPRLHERLALNALREGKSLNNYLAALLEKRVSRSSR